MSKTKEEEIDFSKHLTPDDWGDPQERVDRLLDRFEMAMGIIMILLYPFCFGSGILVAHFFHW